MNGPAGARRPLTVLLADVKPARRYGTKTLLEGEAPHLWMPTRNVRGVGEAETGVEILRLTSTLSSDVVVVDLAIGEAAGDGCSATLLVMTLRFAEVGRVVLFKDEEDLPETNMEEIRKDSGADAAIEAARIAADLANAVVGTKADPA